MLTPRENFLLATVQHKIPEYVPNDLDDTIAVGGPFEFFENGPMGGGFDGFGVEWHASSSAAGAGVPVAGRIVLDDITKWEDIVKFPNLDEYDWEGQAAFQLSRGDRTQKAVEYGCWNAQFLRLTHLMGFENALCALYEEPEACAAFMSAVTDYKILLAERIYHYFKPDIITTFIDVATERGLFMSPETYRKIISPQQQRLNNVIKGAGMASFVHCCGKCEDIIPDFISEGYDAWSSAQPMNDIVGILKKYGDKIAVIGGYNTNGRPGCPDATDEEVEAEVKHVIETYGPYGSFAFFGLKLINTDNSTDLLESLVPINAAVDKYKYIYKK